MFVRYQLAPWLVALALPLAGSAAAATITLAPSKDNTLIQQTNPANQLSNGQGDIFTGRTNQDGAGPATISIRRGLIQFDIAGSGIPMGATITDVQLTVREVQGMNGDRSTTLQRVLQDWGEGESSSTAAGTAAADGDATWLYTFYNFANPGASPTWDTLGGDFSPVVSGSTIISDDLGGLQSFSWQGSSNPQMIADVQDWLDNPAGNFGWGILGDESTGQTAKRLNSGESAVPPALLITYVVPEPSSLMLGVFSAVAGLAVVVRVRDRYSTHT